MSNVIQLIANESTPVSVDATVAAAVQRAVYTVPEVASLLGLSVSSAYAMVRAGQVPARRMGNRWVIPKRRFHAWLDETPYGDEITGRSA